MSRLAAVPAAEAAVRDEPRVVAHGLGTARCPSGSRFEQLSLAKPPEEQYRRNPRRLVSRGCLLGHNHMSKPYRWWLAALSRGVC